MFTNLIIGIDGEAISPSLVKILSRYPLNGAVTLYLDACVLKVDNLDCKDSTWFFACTKLASVPIP
mgnify:CR=1 FL=1